MIKDVLSTHQINYANLGDVFAKIFYIDLPHTQRCPSFMHSQTPLSKVSLYSYSKEAQSGSALEQELLTFLHEDDNID